MDQALIDKANRYLEQGKTLDQVKQLLTQEGWTIEQVNQSFLEYAAAQKEGASPAASSTPVEKEIPNGPSEVQAPMQKPTPTPIPHTEAISKPHTENKKPEFSGAPSAHGAGMKKGLIALIVILLLVGLSAAAYLFFFAEGDSSASNTSSLSSTQTTTPEVNGADNSLESTEALPINSNSNMDSEIQESPQLESAMDDAALSESQANAVSELPSDGLPKLPQLPNTSEESELAQESIVNCPGADDYEACITPYVLAFDENLKTCTPSEGEVAVGFESFLGVFRGYEIMGESEGVCTVNYTALKIPEAFVLDDTGDFYGMEMTCEMSEADLNLEKVHDLTGCSGELSDSIKAVANYI